MSLIRILFSIFTAIFKKKTLSLEKHSPSTCIDKVMVEFELLFQTHNRTINYRVSMINKSMLSVLLVSIFW